MRIVLSGWKSFVVLTSLVLSSVCHATAWHALTQAQRNQAIVTRGNQDIGTVGGSCKDWVRAVVLSASSPANVIIPSTMTAPYDYLWYSDPNAIGLSAPLENAQVGWIIQMKLKSGTPHTAIILSKTASGITLLDSNWSLNNVVQTHYLSFADFYSKLSTTTSYSFYYIL